jgi:hypothetical protein
MSPELAEEIIHHKMFDVLLIGIGIYRGKVTKIQGFRKICCVSIAEVSSRNTRHDRFEQRMKLVVAVYCYAHAIRTYLRQEPLTYFSNAGPF